MYICVYSILRDNSSNYVYEISKMREQISITIDMH